MGERRSRSANAKQDVWPATWLSLVRAGARTRTPEYVYWDNAGIAQLVEQLIRNEKVGGSTPLSGTILITWLNLYRI